MRVRCPHCPFDLPAVWLLQGPRGHIAILADGQPAAVDVTRAVELNLHLLGGFADDAIELAHGGRLDGRDRVQGGGEFGWPDGMYPVALWDAGNNVRLLRDPGGLGETARAYLWLDTNPPAVEPAD